jgi:hypothetical protein
MSRFQSFLVKFGFFFEPVASPFLSLFLKRQLGKWKKNKSISDYEAKVRRVGKFHYNIEMNIDLTPEQSKGVLRNLIAEIFGKVRR